MIPLARRAPNQVLAFYGVLLLACCGLSLLGTTLAGRYLRVVTGEYDRQRKLWRSEVVLARNLPAVRDEHTRKMSDVSSLEPTVATKLYESTLIAQLAELASSNEMQLVGTAPDRQQRDQMLAAGGTADPRHRLIASFAGHYGGLVRLLGALQQAPKIIALEAVDIRTQSGAEDGRLIADLTLLAYEAPGIQAPSTAPPPPALTGAIIELGGADTAPKAAPAPRRRWQWRWPWQRRSTPRPAPAPAPWPAPAPAPGPVLPPQTTVPPPSTAPTPTVPPTVAPVGPGTPAPPAPPATPPTGMPKPGRGAPPDQGLSAVPNNPTPPAQQKPWDVPVRPKAAPPKPPEHAGDTSPTASPEQQGLVF